MINNQPYLDKTRGSFGKLGSIAGNGCGAIAMTNICLMEKKQVDLDKMIRKILSYCDGVLAGGALGTNPVVVPRIMKSFGFKVKYLGNLKSINQLKNYKYFIVLYTWKNKAQLGAHYQAGRLLNNQLELFNPYAVYDSVEEFKHGESAICPIVYGVNI